MDANTALKNTSHKKHNELFYHFFPVPRYLAMPTVGIDISEKTVRFVELRPAREGVVLNSWGSKEIPPGVVSSGELLQPEEIKKVLNSIKTEHGFSYAAVSMPEEKAYLFKTRIPAVHVDGVRENIEFTLEENVPMSRAESVFDYTILPPRNIDDKIDAMVSVLPIGIVDSYLKVFQSIGCSPIIFQVESQAVARAVIKDGDMGTYMIVNFSKSKTDVFIVSEGTVQYSSVINIGGEDLTALIQKFLHVNEVEAEKIKFTEGLVRRPDNEIVFNSIIATISALKDEINRLFIYWHTYKDITTGGGNPRVQKIILVGKDSLIEGFDDYLASALKIHVEIGNIWININPELEEVPGIPYADSLDYATAIGLSLQRIF